MKFYKRNSLKNGDCFGPKGRALTRAKIVLTSALLFTVAITNAQTDSTAFTYQKPLFDFDNGKPVFKLQSEQMANKNGSLRFSALTGYREGIKRVNYAYAYKLQKDQPLPGTLRFYMYNLSIAEMLKLDPTANMSDIILEVKDPSKYKYDPKYGPMEDWLKKNGHCYELILPASVVNMQTLEEDLSMQLGVKFSKQKRMVKALILVRTSDIDKMKSKGTSNEVRSAMVPDKMGGMMVDGVWRNMSISYLPLVINFDGMLPPVVDETDYTGNVDLDLEINSFRDLPALRKALQRYDLDLKEGMRELDMLVITENDWKP